MQRIQNVVALGTPGEPSPIPEVTIDDGTVAEGSGTGTTLLVFPIRLTAPSNAPVQVSFSTEVTGSAADEATPGDDYDAVSGAVYTISPGQTQVNAMVTINRDFDAEYDEFVQARITFVSGPGNTTIARSVARGTITNDDGEPGDAYNVTLSGGTVTEGAPGENPQLEFVVDFGAVTNVQTSFDFETLPTGTATEGVDYQYTQTTVFHPSGSRFAYVYVDIIGDDVLESNETVDARIYNLVAPTGSTIATGTASGTITDDDVQYAIDLETGTGDRLESDNAAGVVNNIFRIRVIGTDANAPRRAGGTVKFRTLATGTATPGTDFEAVDNYVVSIPSGSTAAYVEIPVRIYGDYDPESSETIVGEIYDLDTTDNRAYINTSQHSVTISDNDQVANYRLVTTTPLVDEDAGSAMFRVENINPASKPFDGATVQITFETFVKGVANEAVAGTDYVAKTQTVTFTNSSATFFDIPVSLIDNEQLDGDRQLYARIKDMVTNDPRAQLAGTEAYTTIQNEDTAYFPLLTGSSQSESSSNLVFTVRAYFEDVNGNYVGYSSPPEPITGMFRTLVPTQDQIDNQNYAEPGVDFTAVDTGFTLTSSSVNINVPIISDLDIEGIETVMAEIYNIQSDSPRVIVDRVADHSATGMITNDDQPVVFTVNRSATNVTEGDPGDNITARFYVTSNRAVAPGKTINVRLVTTSNDRGFSYSAGDRLAVAGTDYTAIDQTLTFTNADGVVSNSSKFVDVPIIADNTEEDDALVFVEIAEITGDDPRGQSTGTNAYNWTRITDEDFPALQVTWPYPANTGEEYTANQQRQFSESISISGGDGNYSHVWYVDKPSFVTEFNGDTLTNYVVRVKEFTGADELITVGLDVSSTDGQTVTNTTTITALSQGAPITYDRMTIVASAWPFEEAVFDVNSSNRNARIAGNKPTWSVPPTPADSTQAASGNGISVIEFDSAINLRGLKFLVGADGAGEPTRFRVRYWTGTEWAIAHSGSYFTRTSGNTVQSLLLNPVTTTKIEIATGNVASGNDLFMTYIDIYGT